MSPVAERSRSLPAAVLLLLALLVSGVMFATAGTGIGGANAPTSVEGWHRQAQSLRQAGKPEAAIEACRAGLVVDPWNPEICRTLTLLELEQGQPDSLKMWMDELVVGDARQADQLFSLPEFKEWLDDPEISKLQQEAWMQARD